MAADLAREGERGKAVGIAFSGVLCGILLARVVSGAVGQWLGWREAFWLACAFAVLLSALLACLPLTVSAIRFLRRIKCLRANACAVFSQGMPDPARQRTGPPLPILRIPILR